MISLYERAFYPKGHPKVSEIGISDLYITVETLVTPKSPLLCDEQYTIDVTDKIYVTAKNLFGVSRALSTVS